MPCPHGLSELLCPISTCYEPLTLRWALGQALADPRTRAGPAEAPSTEKRLTQLSIFSFKKIAIPNIWTPSHLDLKLT